MQEHRASPSCPVAGAATLLVPTPFLPCTIGATMHLYLLQHDSAGLAADLAQFLLAKPMQERLAAVASPIFSYSGMFSRNGRVNARKMGAIS